ncbi:MAG: putative ABC transport system permease protein [Planctomycetota bacterium]|jgi:putative ABC transport system permease protein
MSRRNRPGLGTLFVESLRSLGAHPMRSILTALSVTFGAAALLVLQGYATSVPEATAAVLRGMGSKEFIVEPQRARRGGGGGSRSGRSVRIRYADLGQIRDACPSIDGLAPTYRPGRGGPVFASNRSWPWATVTGVGYEYQHVTDLKLDSGRWFTEQEETGGIEVALVSRQLIDGMFDGRSPVGESIDARGTRFEIIGVFQSKASFAYSLLIPYPTAMAMGDNGGRYVSSIAFAPISTERASEAVTEIREALGTIYSFDPTDDRALDVKENTAFVAKVKYVSLGLELLVMAIAILALVLGCLGAANVVGISVSERTAELGLRKALGATPGRIRAEVLLETLLLCVFGGVLGVALGQAAIALLGPLRFSDQIILQPSASNDLLALAFGVLVVTATLAGLPAASRAARLDPIVALRDD